MSSGLIKWTLLLSLLLTTPGYSADVEPAPAGQESDVSRAIFINSQLWMLTDAGLLSSITEGANRRVDIPLPEPALDLWIEDGEPAVLTGDHNGPSWTLRQWQSGAWRTTATITTNGDQFLGIASTAQTATVLTSRRRIELVGSEQRSLALKWPDKPLAGITSIAATHDGLLVGFNIGEWGGGLRLIDNADGQITIVESKGSDSICSGPLNTDCDPVNGIAVEPWRENCAVIAVGLIHFMAHGSIVEVCSHAVNRLYSHAYGDDPNSTVPFFGIVKSDTGLWTVGADGVYRIAPGGVKKVSPLPEFQRIGNVSVSFAMPQVVLLLTDVNQRQSLSGSVPMIVAR